MKLSVGIDTGFGASGRMITAVKSVRPTVLVELEDENGQLRLLRQKDHYLYEQQIEEGDQVILEQEILKRIE